MEKKHFTLIELIIVIVVLSILLAIPITIATLYFVKPPISYKNYNADKPAIEQVQEVKPTVEQVQGDKQW